MKIYCTHIRNFPKSSICHEFPQFATTSSTLYRALCGGCTYVAKQKNVKMFLTEMFCLNRESSLMGRTLLLVCLQTPRGHHKHQKHQKHHKHHKHRKHASNYLQSNQHKDKYTDILCEYIHIKYPNNTCDNASINKDCVLSTKFSLIHVLEILSEKSYEALLCQISVRRPPASGRG